MSLEENVKNTDVWSRGFFILVSGVIYYLLFFLLLLIVLFQFVSKLTTTELNTQLLDFSDGLTRYINQILRYVTFKSDERPYPFSPWPDANVADSTEPAAAPRQKKKTARKKKTAAKKTTGGDQDSADTK